MGSVQGPYVQQVEDGFPDPAAPTRRPVPRCGGEGTVHYIECPLITTRALAVMLAARAPPGEGISAPHGRLDPSCPVGKGGWFF